MTRALRLLRVAFRYARRALLALLLLLAAALAASELRRPSNDRDWVDGVERAPRVAAFDGDRVTIENFRDFRWAPGPEVVERRWRTETLALGDIVGADFVLVPLGEWEGAAHTFLTFEFASSTGRRFVSVSVEARRERGEEYSLARGLFNEYELVYVIGSEEDLVGLRAVGRGSELYRYRLDVPADELRRLFAHMAIVADDVAAVPEFYGTLWNSCTTRVVAHARAANGAPVPISWRYVMPGYSAELAHELGLLETDGLPFEALRERAKIGEKAREAYGREGFSEGIRE